jgi:hypothetical protein
MHCDTEAMMVDGDGDLPPVHVRPFMVTLQARSNARESVSVLWAVNPRRLRPFLGAPAAALAIAARLHFTCQLT